MNEVAVMVWVVAAAFGVLLVMLASCVRACCRAVDDLRAAVLLERRGCCRE